MGLANISYENLTAGSCTIDASSLCSTACSTTYIYAPPTSGSGEDEAEESALDWLDRRVDEMRVEL